ncbi:hypothetical protein [Nocardioides yefusunii]|uniref:Lipoprotein n=1 Tax=Nocardioides yefusunii TaxID=2500546 RepID=A0ABW1R1R1_9ACTN|nr:hypothetical protein [Nocardioides yefusunii]
MRFVRPLAACALTAALLTGCSSESETVDPGPQAATVDEYCEAYRPFVDAETISEQDESDIVAGMKTFAAAVGDMVAPVEMSADEVLGLTMWVERVSSLPDDATQRQVEKALTKGVKEIDELRMNQFITFGNSVCF